MHVNVKLTANLSKFYAQDKFSIEADSLRQLFLKMDLAKPGFSAKILDESGAIKKHVNVYVNGKVAKRDALESKLSEGCEIQIVQALAGG